MTIRPLILAAAAAATAAMATAVPAVAAPTGGVSVNYDELDLSTEAGRTELAARFDKAAKEMCGVTESDKLRGKQRYCYETTSKSMKARVASIISQHEQASGG